MTGAGQFLRRALRGDQPYWRAYSLFAMHLVIVLVAAWCVLEWSRRSSGGEPQTALRSVALLLATMAPTLWILWSCAQNIRSNTSRLLARAGVAAAVVLLATLVCYFWNQ